MNFEDRLNHFLETLYNAKELNQQHLERSHPFHQHLQDRDNQPLKDAQIRGRKNITSENVVYVNFRRDENKE